MTAKINVNKESFVILPIMVKLTSPWSRTSLIKTDTLSVPPPPSNRQPECGRSKNPFKSHPKSFTRHFISNHPFRRTERRTTLLND